MKSKYVCMLILPFLLLAYPYTAYAECIPSDIAGTWRAFIVTGSTSFQGFARAKLVFSEAGQLNTANSEFTNSSNRSVRFQKGNIRVSSSCRITGNLLAKSGVILKIVDGQMNGSKDVISGVYRTSAKDIGLINLIK